MNTKKQFLLTMALILGSVICSGRVYADLQADAKKNLEMAQGRIDAAKKELDAAQRNFAEVVEATQKKLLANGGAPAQGGDSLTIPERQRYEELKKSVGVANAQLRDLGIKNDPVSIVTKKVVTQKRDVEKKELEILRLKLPIEERKRDIEANINELRKLIEAQNLQIMDLNRKMGGIAGAIYAPIKNLLVEDQGIHEKELNELKIQLSNIK